MPQNWRNRDVLVGVLHSVPQLDFNLEYRFYHIPVRMLACRPEEVRVAALYQSKKLFGDQFSGIRFYGRVTGFQILSRGEILEIPARRNRDEQYYKFQISNWEPIPKPIRAVGLAPGVSMLTTEFLLRNARNFPELYIRTEDQWDLYCRLCRAARNSRDGGSERIPSSGGNTVLVSGYQIGVYSKDGRYDQYDLRDFFYEPYSFLTYIQSVLEGSAEIGGYSKEIGPQDPRTERRGRNW